MTLKIKKYILVAAVFGVWLVADLVTKHWADTTLATRRHPLPVQVTGADDGKPLGDVLKARFGWDDQALADHIGDVERLEPPATVASTDHPYDTAGPAANAHGYYFFWRGDRSTPPRRFDKDDRTRIARWVMMTLPAEQAAEAQQKTYELVKSWTFETWLPQRYRQLSESDVAALVPSHLHPVSRVSRLTAQDTVKAGETYLLTHHQVDVMGDWFKFVYAENPNAAFGFMKGVPPATRHTLFSILTIIAFLVILYIIYRLPAKGWWVYVAFAGILAGAAGNFIDRLRFSYVIDFIDMDLGFMHWPTYNVADIAISLGVIALILDILFNKDSPLVSQKDKDKREAKRKAKEEARKAAAA